jgi:membrane protease YdiL (CAAX protease family)
MRVLVAAVVSEGLLAVGAFLIALVTEQALTWNLTLHTATQGALLTVPPLIMNAILWRYSETHPDSVYGRFSSEIIVPLCRHMNLVTTCIVAALSGSCEELFFRGALNYLCSKHLGVIAACAVTSILFALVHFIGNFRRYGAMIPIYVVVGLYLWGVHYGTHSLAAVAITHGLYNFIVITMVRIKVLRTYRQTSLAPRG